MTSGRRSEQVPPLAIILDENIAAEDLRTALAETARRHNARVELIMDHFERGTPDETWLPVAAERRWAVITCDAHIKKRPAEKLILMTAGVSVFILRGALKRRPDPRRAPCGTPGHLPAASSAHATDHLPRVARRRCDGDGRQAAWRDQAVTWFVSALR